jgi:hypothetical protein
VNNDGGWYWTDGSPVSFSNWFPGLPNNQDIITGGPESCLQVNSLPMFGGIHQRLYSKNVSFENGV